MSFLAAVPLLVTAVAMKDLKCSDYKGGCICSDYVFNPFPLTVIFKGIVPKIEFSTRTTITEIPLQYRRKNYVSIYDKDADLAAIL